MSRAPFIAMRTDLRKEERVRFCADFAGYNEDEALGKFFRLWSWCADRGLQDAPDDCAGYAVEDAVVRRFLGARGVEAILGDGCDALAMGERRPDGLIYLRGTSDTVDRIRALRTSATAGGKALAEKVRVTGRGNGGRFESKRTDDRLTIQPSPAASSEIPDPTDQIPEEKIPDPPPARAIAPTVVQVETDSAPVHPEPHLPPPITLPVAWSGPPDHRALAARRKLALEIRAEVDAARERAGKALGEKALPLLAQDPGEGLLATRILGMPDLATGRDHLLHIVAMAEAEAIAERKLQFLTLSAIFAEKNATRFAGGTAAEFRRKPAKARSMAEVIATPAEMEIARSVLRQLSADSGIPWRVEDGHASLVVDRLRELVQAGADPARAHVELLAVVTDRGTEWKGKEATVGMLKPRVVFGANFGEYLTEARALYGSDIAKGAAEQRKAGA